MSCKSWMQPSAPAAVPYWSRAEGLIPQISLFRQAARHMLPEEGGTAAPASFVCRSKYPGRLGCSLSCLTLCCERRALHGIPCLDMMKLAVVAVVRGHHVSARLV